MSKKIPNAILEFNGVPNKKLGIKAEEKKEKPKNSYDSQFLITINTNLGYKKFNKESRIELANKLNNALEQIEKGIENKSLYKLAESYGKKMHGAKKNKAEVKKLVSGLEIGKKKGHLHAHMVVEFTGTTHLDPAKMHEILKNNIGEYYKEGKKPRLKIKYIPDTSAILQNYVLKDQDFTSLSDVDSSSSEEESSSDSD